MRTKRCLIMFLIVLLLAVGCANTEPREEQPTVSTQTYRIERWQLFEGEVNLSHTGELSIVEINEPQEGIYTVGGNQYMAFSVPEGKYELSANSGWRIALGELFVLGVTKDGAFVLGSCQENPLILCLYNADTDQKQCLMQIDLIEKGVAFFAIDEFALYLDGEPVQDMEQAVSLWRIHTGDNYEVTGWPILHEEEAIKHSLVMILRDHPTIKYEINVIILGSTLYMENINSQSHVAVPAYQILGDK